MLSEKHFSLPVRQKYFPASSPPATLLTLRLYMLDRFAPLRSGPVSLSVSEKGRLLAFWCANVFSWCGQPR